MSRQPTETALVSQPTAPWSPDAESISHVRALRDHITEPENNSTDNGEVTPRRVKGNSAARTTKTVTLVIPAKNEAANIAWVLEQIPSCVDEVILVDGNSTDATLVTARACRPDVRVVAQQRTGKGDALRAGFLAASGDIIAVIDADGSMLPGEIPHFLYFLNNGYDFVKGSRFTGGGGSLDITWIRRLGNRGLLFLLNTLYRTHLTDLCYGFCAFHRRYLGFLDPMTAGFEIDAHMIIRAVQSGLRIAEVPSLELPRRHGKSNLRTFRDGMRILRTMLREHKVSGQIVHAVRHWVHTADLISSRSPRKVKL